MSEAGEKGGWEQGRAERANRIETFLGHWMIARRPSLTGEDEDILKLCREVVACAKPLPRSLLEFRSEMRHWHDSWFARAEHLLVPRQLFSLDDLRTRRMFEPTCLAYHITGTIHGVFVRFLDLASFFSLSSFGPRVGGYVPGH